MDYVIKCGRHFSLVARLIFRSRASLLEYANGIYASGENSEFAKIIRENNMNFIK